MLVIHIRDTEAGKKAFYEEIQSQVKMIPIPIKEALQLIIKKKAILAEIK